MSKNANLKNLSSIMTSAIPSNTHLGLEISRAKFHVFTIGSFRRVKTNTLAYRIALYSVGVGNETRNKV